MGTGLRSLLVLLTESSVHTRCDTSTGLCTRVCRQCLRKQSFALVHHRAQRALKLTAGALGRWQGAHRQVQKPTARKGREVATFSARSLAVQSLLPGPCRDRQPRLRSGEAPTPSHLLGLPGQPEGAAQQPADT